MPSCAWPAPPADRRLRFCSSSGTIGSRRKTQAAPAAESAQASRRGCTLPAWDGRGTKLPSPSGCREELRLLPPLPAGLPEGTARRASRSVPSPRRTRIAGGTRPRPTGSRAPRLGLSSPCAASGGGGGALKTARGRPSCRSGFGDEPRVAVDRHLSAEACWAGAGEQPGHRPAPGSGAIDVDVAGEYYWTLPRRARPATRAYFRSWGLGRLGVATRYWRRAPGSGPTADGGRRRLSNGDDQVHKPWSGWVGLSRGSLRDNL